MKTVLVTGAFGFIGSNLAATLALDDQITVLKFGRENTDSDLKNYVEKADFIFHVAGVNRPKDDSEFTSGNKELTEKIITLLEQQKTPAPLLFTSSTHAERDSAYGASKKAAEDAVLQWAAKNPTSRAFIYRLPNVFGKWSRPNYNSVVSTFCYNISHDQDITINDRSIPLNLVYIDDVVAECIRAFKGELTESKSNFYDLPRSFNTTLGEIADILISFKQSRVDLVMPSFENIFHKFLYATYVSYLDKDNFSYTLDMKRDDRGWLAEFIKAPAFGQIFLSRTKPGITRGNHWHHTKVEKFLVIEGQAAITFRKLDTDEIITYSVNGEDLQVVDIPTGYVHAIKNTGNSDLLTLFWANELLDPNAPDTHYQNVTKD